MPKTATKTYIFHMDPAHGWLAVKLSDLAAVHLSLSDISPYSYQRGQTVYLEEDVDMPRFVDAFRSKFAKAPAMSTSRNRSTLRGYSPVRSFARVGSLQK